MRALTATLLLIAGLASPVAAQQWSPAGGPTPPPFVATLSNNTPLAFGMDQEIAARALGTPLNYVSGCGSSAVRLLQISSNRLRATHTQMDGSWDRI